MLHELVLVIASYPPAHLETHIDDPVVLALSVPRGHARHCEEFEPILGLKVPAPHGMQADSDVEPNKAFCVPAGHG